MFEKVEFTMLESGTIIDLRPMYENKPPLRFEGGNWVAYNGSQKDILNSKPIDFETIKILTMSSSPSAEWLQ